MNRIKNSAIIMVLALFCIPASFAKPPLPLPNLGNTCHANSAWQMLLYAAGDLRKKLVECYVDEAGWHEAIKTVPDKTAYGKPKEAVTPLAQLAMLMEYGAPKREHFLLELSKRIAGYYKNNRLAWIQEYKGKIETLEKLFTDNRYNGRHLNAADAIHLFIILRAIAQAELCKIGESADPRQWGILMGLEMSIAKLNCTQFSAQNLFGYQFSRELLWYGTGKREIKDDHTYVRIAGVYEKKLVPFASNFVKDAKNKPEPHYEVKYTTQMPKYALVEVSSTSKFDRIPDKDLAVSFEKTGDKNSIFKLKENYPTYCLIAAIIHGGGKWDKNGQYQPAGGHYTAYVHDPDTPLDAGDWYHCNDAQITKVSLATIKQKLQQGFKNEDWWGKGGYFPKLLLYERSEKPAVVDAPSSVGVVRKEWAAWIEKLKTLIPKK